MKNKEFQKLLKTNRSKSNSGFTLTELLVGVVMSTFVIGALGFGLMQVLRTTQSEGSRTAARNETSRALEFVSDEMRRAQAIEVNNNIAYITRKDDAKTADIDEKVAPNFKLLKDKDKKDIKPSLVLQVPGVDERIVYTVAPPQTNTWKGPLVIYRWGPALTADGSYETDPKKDGRVNNPAGWENEALIDGISDVEQSANCGKDDKDKDIKVKYKGFFACILDDDGDGLVENAKDTNTDGKITFADNATDTNEDGKIDASDGLIDFNGDGTVDASDGYTDKNGDGKIDVNDSKLIDTNGDGSITKDDNLIDINGDGKINEDDGADVDGKAITAQLYFTGGTQTAGGKSDIYSADTKAVTRSRTAPENNSQNLTSYTMSFRSLNPSFACNTDSSNDWKLRTDFGESVGSPSDLAKWNHDKDKPRQPQPIKITGNTLAISAIPRGASGDCLNSRANNGREANQTPPRDFSGNKTLGKQDDWTSDDTVVAITHVISFDDPRTFNGNTTSCPGNPCHSTNGNVLTHNPGAAATANPYVKMLKAGSEVPNYGGYDPEGDGTDADNDGVVDPGNQQSLGEFLVSQNLARLESGTYIVENLGYDERIVAFEVGQTDISTSNKGTDFQDNIFIVKSDAFKKKYDTYKDGNYDSSVTPNPPEFSPI